MTERVSRLVAQLVDKVSGPASKIGSALRAAEKQAAAIHRATAAGLGNKFTADLHKLGASAGQIDRVTRAFEKYRRSAGLAADSTTWTQAQAAQVRNWERAHLSALKAINAQRGGIHGHLLQRAAPTPAGGPTAGQGALMGAAAARIGMSAAALPAAGAVAVGAGIAKATQEALSFERVMYEVEKATDANGEASKRYADAILDLATRTGKTKEELGGLLAAAGFAGRPRDELLRFTEYAAKATGAWGTTATETGQALAEVGNIYQANQTRIEEIGDAINSVADASASKETDLLDFLRRSGAQAKILGISAEQTLAYGAALKEVGVQSEVAATGFNALLNKLATGAEDDGLKSQLNTLGLDAKAFVTTLKKDAPAAINSLLSAIDKVGDGTRKLAILKEIFGQEYADDIARLSGNLAGVERLLRLVANRASYLGSVDKSFTLLTEKDYNRLERASQQIDRLWVRLGTPPKQWIGAFAEQLNNLLDRIEKSDPNAPKPEAQQRFDKLLNQILRRTDSSDDWYRQEEARQQKAGRDAVYAKRSGYDREIAEKQARLDQMPKGPFGPLRPFLEKEIAGIRSERDALTKALAARDDANIRLVENEAERRRLLTRMSGLPDEKPRPIKPGLLQFGFGPHGQAEHDPVPVEPMFRTRVNEQSVTRPAPLPPRRPESGPAARPDEVLKLQNFDDIYKPSVDSSAVDQLSTKANEAGQTLEGLNQTIAPQVNLSPLQELSRTLDDIIGKMSRISGQAAAARRDASAAAASFSAAPAGRGRNDVQQATAALSRSRETNLQDRPLA